MPEPLGVEERARLRASVQEIDRRHGRVSIAASKLHALLDEVDRLTEALEAAEQEVDGRILRLADRNKARAERAEADLAAAESEAQAVAQQNVSLHADLADEKRRRAAEIAAAEQRGREDNADHGQCYVHGSEALAALIAEARAEGAAGLRAGVEALAAEYGCSCLLDYRPCVGCRARTLLDTATEETGG